MKRAIRIIELLLLVIALAFILWPSGLGAPEIFSPEPESGQDERALHLELAQIYERGGKLEDAQGEYEQAISPQKELGKSLTNVIHITLQGSKLIHLTGESGAFALSENLDMPSFGIVEEKSGSTAELLAAIDSFKVGTVDLPLGQLVSAVQRWTGEREYR